MGTQPQPVTRATPDSDAAPEVVPTQLRVASTRASRTWVKVLPGLVVLAVLLIFVFQNLRSTKVSFFTVSTSVPLALALVAAAALSALCVLALGSVRILQLRKTIRTRRRPH